MNLEELTEFLSIERINRGITQVDLAIEIGKSRVTIVNWETGYYVPSIHGLIKWAKALGYTIDFKLNKEAEILD
jgi:transcriptional regulator with XRE-family HTH domain